MGLWMENLMVQDEWGEYKISAVVRIRRNPYYSLPNGDEMLAMVFIHGKYQNVQSSKVIVFISQYPTARVRVSAAVCVGTHSINIRRNLCLLRIKNLSYRHISF